MLDAELVRDLLMGVEERGLVDTCKILISGFLGSAAIAAVVIDFVRGAKARNPKLLYLRDPVMGDADLGFYVNEDIRALFCEGLVRTSLLQPSLNWCISLGARPQRLKGWWPPPAGLGSRRCRDRRAFPGLPRISCRPWRLNPGPPG